MAEFVNNEVKVVMSGDKIEFSNKTSSPFFVSTGISFLEDGEYHVSVHNGRVSVTMEPNVELMNCDTPNEEDDEIKDCTTCYWGRFNDHWMTHFCYHDGDCKKWELWEPKKNDN